MPRIPMRLRISMRLRILRILRMLRGLRGLWIKGRKDGKDRKGRVTEIKSYELKYGGSGRAGGGLMAKSLNGLMEQEGQLEEVPRSWDG